MFKNLSTEALGFSGRQSEIIELALSFGFRGIDLDILDFADQVEKHGLDHARRLLDSAKLLIGGFTLPFDMANDAAYAAGLSALPRQAELAAELGCQRALTMVQPGSDERPFHENFELHRTRLAETAALLDKAGLALGVGFLPAPSLRAEKAFEFVHAFDTLLTLLQLVGASNVGAVVDLWSLHVTGADLSVLGRLKPEQIIAVRLADLAADAAQPAEDVSRLLPGESGVIDAAAALTALAELGYTGPVTPQPHPGRFEGLGRTAIVKLAGEQLDAVWKAAGLTRGGKLSAAAEK